MTFHRGYGGFFNAISSLCPKAEETYSMAHKMGDLKMGDAHLVPVETGSDENAETRTFYVANLICQSRVGGRISAINMEKLALGLKKIALAANAMKGKDISKLGKTGSDQPKQLLFTCRGSVHTYQLRIIIPSSAWFELASLIRKFRPLCK